MYHGNMDATAKICTKCRETKQLDEFHKRADGKYGRRADCIDCCRGADRGRYAANPESKRAAVAARVAADPEAKRQRDQAYHLAHPERVRVSAHRRRARLAGATIEPVDAVAVLASRPDCYLCGCLLAADVHLDHIVPLARGGAHSSANLAPTHDVCNLRKGDRLLSELDWYAGPVDIGTNV